MKRKFIWLFSAIVFLGNVSCSATFNHKLNYNPKESIRVAVLPFAQVDESGAFIENEGTLAVDEIPIIFSETKGSPEALSRKLVYAELSRTSIDVVSPFFVDIDLPHRGFAHADGRFDHKKIFATHPSVYCKQFLDCDAVLFGTIHKWDRSYYGVESSNEIDIELKLVAADSGKVLYQARASDSEGRGLTKGPTGYSSLVIEPIRGLDSDLIEGLARRTISTMLRPLRSKGINPEDKTSPPAVYAASHDADSGVINEGSAFLVVAFASSGMNASFSIGEYVRGVPMFETSPGHYAGEYWLLPGQSFSTQTVKVTLIDSLGRSSSLEVDSGSVSASVDEKKSVKSAR